MAAPISGTWKRTAQFFDVPPAQHTADPRHRYLGHEPGPGEYAHEAPPGPERTPAGTPDFGSQEVIDTHGHQLDQTDYRVHEGDVGGIAYTRVPDLDEPGGADEDFLRRTHRVHGRDQGASRQHNFLEKALQFFDERYWAERISGFGIEATRDIPALAGGGGRGLNGLPENNPPLVSYDGAGFRAGITEQFGVRRKFAVRIIQRHDQRPWTPNLAYREPDAPAPRPGNAATSPFSALQRVIASVSKRPELRRQPPELGDVLAEQTIASEPGESVYDAVGAW